MTNSSLLTVTTTASSYFLLHTATAFRLPLTAAAAAYCRRLLPPTAAAYRYRLLQPLSAYR